MSHVTTDREFKTSLNPLTIVQQRLIGALFVANVLHLCKDYRVKKAVEVAQNPNISGDELVAVYKSAKSASVETFTQCGKDVDWLGQASHFVAAASTVCVTPPDQLQPTDNLAWNAAMQARLARTFETIAAGEGSENQEAQQQYEILEKFLQRI
jgi:hypothetical protein